MESARASANDAGTNDQILRRGWRLGGEAFLARLLDRMEGKLSEHHIARERSETAEMKAERIIQSALHEIG